MHVNLIHWFSLSERCLYLVIRYNTEYLHVKMKLSQYQPTAPWLHRTGFEPCVEIIIKADFKNQEVAGEPTWLF